MQEVAAAGWESLFGSVEQRPDFFAEYHVWTNVEKKEAGEEERFFVIGLLCWTTLFTDKSFQIVVCIFDTLQKKKVQKFEFYKHTQKKNRTIVSPIFYFVFSFDVDN